MFFFQSQRKIKVSFQAAFPQVPADLFQLVPSVTCRAGSGAPDQSCNCGSATWPACSLSSSLAARTGVPTAICNAISAPSISRGIVSSPAGCTTVSAGPGGLGAGRLRAGDASPSRWPQRLGNAPRPGTGTGTGTRQLRPRSFQSATSTSRSGGPRSW